MTTIDGLLRTRSVGSNADRMASWLRREAVAAWHRGETERATRLMKAVDGMARELKGER